MLLFSFHRNTQICALMEKLVPRSTVEITNTVSVQEPVFVVGYVVVQQLENKSQAGDTKQEYREVNFSAV